MSGQRPGSYPSPTSAQVGSGVPFYNQSAVSQAADVPAMVQLSEELTRQLHDNINVHHGENTMLQQSMGQAMHAPDSHQQMAQDAIGALVDGRPDFEEDEEEASASEGGTRKRKRQKTKDDKRQKNTRACDECRRKKVKCESEAGSEMEMGACLACKKSGLNCQFSRVPQKRGPSKGYISKLDERLQNVEGAIRDYVPGAAHRIGKPEPADLSMYDPDHPDDIQPSHPSDMHQAQSGATNHTHLDYTGDGDTSSFWHSAPQMSSATSELVAALQAATSQDLDENALNDCYQIMQGTLPILPTDQALLRSLLAQVLDGTRSAFSSSLGCFVRATSPGKGEVDLSQIKTAAGLFGQAEFEPPSTAKSLILIATAMFLALATEALGPAPSHGGASPSSRDWLSRANGIANNIKIHMKPSPQKLTEGAGDTEAKFARRLYVALFIMDKRLAIAYATPQLISASGLTLIAEDRNLLGQQCYYLARLSFVLAHVADLLSELTPSDTADSTSSASPLQHIKNLAAKICQGELDRVREDMQPFITNLPIVHADFWHIQSIVSRLQEHVTQPTLVGHVNKVLAILPDPSVQSFPFFHQFTALAGLTIAEFAVQKGADGVANEANALDHVLSVRSGKEGGWEQAIGNFVMSATGGSSAMIGLQGLAEVAVGDGQAAREVFDGKFEPVKVLREGYLSFFVPLPKN